MKTLLLSLKLTGSIWTFGINTSGQAATGDYLTYDKPSKTNILSTYDDIKVGDDFILALRSDGTVWASGNNKEGQLGDATYNNRNKLTQIQDMAKIKKIEAGGKTALALDDLGIVYEWGNGVTKPKTYDKITVRVIDISAGKNQNAFVTTKGKVLGFGNILNGEVPGISNAIKTQVTNDSIIILTSDFNVYEYKAGTLTQIQITPKVIDISSNGNNIMLQTVDEEVYLLGQNTNGELGIGNTNLILTPTKPNIHGENVFGISSGINNTYIIETTGNVYTCRK